LVSAPIIPLPDPARILVYSMYEIREARVTVRAEPG